MQERDINMILVSFSMFLRPASSLAAQPRSSAVHHITEVQDGGWQTGNGYNFRLEQDIDAAHIFDIARTNAAYSDTLRRRPTSEN
jgi:hypothetical protein